MQDNVNKKSLLIIIFTVFVDMLGFGILIPVIPQLLANPRSEYFLLPQTMTISQGYILLGFLLASFSVMQFLATPILGQLSDKFGRKKILALSLSGTVISYLLFVAGIEMRSIPLLFFARAFDGITGGNISVAQAAIADITKPENRTKTFGLIGAAFGLGFILGPYIGGKLSDPTIVSWFNAATPFWFAAGLSFLNTLSVLLFLPETLKVKSGQAVEWFRSVRNIVKVFSLENLRSLILTNFLFQAGFTFFTTFFSVFLINRFNFTQGNIGDFFSYVGLWIAITQAVVTRAVSKKLKESQVLRFSLILTGIFILSYFIPNTWWQLLLVVPLFAIFNGLSQANATALVSRSADQSVQGEILGINSSVLALAQAIPAMLSGYIAASLTPEAPIVVSSAVIIFAGLVFIFLYKPRLEKVVTL